MTTAPRHRGIPDYAATVAHAQARRMLMENAAIPNVFIRLLSAGADFVGRTNTFNLFH